MTQTGTTYAITFVNGKAGLDIAELTPTTSASTPGGTITVQTTVNGGFSKAKSVQLTFDSTNWWIPQSVIFVVNTKAESIGTNAYFQNSAQVQCTVETPVPNCTKVIKGTVTSGNSIDMNSHTVGDEYATLTASTPVFDAFRPTSTLPEGLRGAQLKISGNDPEAEGQIRLVLGSYLTHVQLGGATGGSFTLSSGPRARPPPDRLERRRTGRQGRDRGSPRRQHGRCEEGRRRLRRRAPRHALPHERRPVHRHRRLVGGSPSRHRRLDDQGQLGLVGRALPGAAFEVSLFGGVKVPAVRVAVYPSTVNLVVVAESDGSTQVSQGDMSITSNDDTIEVRLSAAPTSGPVTVYLGDHGAGLITYSLSANGAPITSLVFNSSNWNDLRHALRPRRRRRRHPRLPSRRPAPRPPRTTSRISRRSSSATTTGPASASSSPAARRT